MSLQLTRSDVSSTWNGQDEMSVLTFNLNDETFAIKAMTVQEILDLLPETRVRGAKAYLGGVINFRGKVIPLADIRLAFGMEAGAATIESRIIVVQLDIDGESCLVAIRTCKVYEVTTLTQASSEPPPSVGVRWRADFIDCLVKRNSEFVIVPNLKTIFASH